MGRGITVEKEENLLIYANECVALKCSVSENLWDFLQFGWQFVLGMFVLKVLLVGLGISWKWKWKFIQWSSCEFQRSTYASATCKCCSWWPKPSMQPLFAQKASGPKNSDKIIGKFISTSSDAHPHLLFLQLGRLLLSLLLRLNFLLSTGHAGIYWIYVNFFVIRNSARNRSFNLQFMRLVYRINDVDDFSDELEDLAINSALKIYNFVSWIFSNVDTFVDFRHECEFCRADGKLKFEEIVCQQTKLIDTKITQNKW